MSTNVMNDSFLTCRLPEDDMQALRTLATTYGTNRSEALRRVIRKAIRELSGTNGKIQKEVNENE